MHSANRRSQSRLPAAQTSGASSSVRIFCILAVALRPSPSESLPLPHSQSDSLEMGAGSSSAASKARHDAPSSRTFAVTQTTILSAAHSLRIQELEAQVRELKARPALAPAPSPPHVSELTGLYSASIALSTSRRDEAYMKEVFDRHKATERGIEREDALIAALQEVDAPVLTEQTSVFRLADKNMNGYVGFDE